MQPRNPDWDNPNIQQPDMPNQDGGTQHPNMPNYDPNVQGSGISGQQVPNYDPNAQARQESMPGQQTPVQGHPVMYAAPDGSPYSDAEWKILMATPLKVGKAMMLASPSGPVGLIQETKALVDCLRSLLSQNTANPLIRELSGRAKNIVNTARSGDPKSVLFDLIGTSHDPAASRTDALNGCQQAASILRKASPQDAAEYKQFVFTGAQKVAEAAREGGFLGISGEKVAPAEQSLLKDIVNTLDIQRA